LGPRAHLSDGSRDPSFGDEGIAGGKLDDTFADTFAVDGIARIDVTGGTDAAHGLALQANGKIVLAWNSGSPRFLVARLKAG
jgi:hypothetical protein